MRMLNRVQTGAKVYEDRQDTYKVPADNKIHRIRIVPGTYGGDVDGTPGRMWYVEMFQHWYPNPQSQKGFSKSCVCRATQRLRGLEVGTKEECPFCLRWEALKEEERNIASDLLSLSGPEATELKARKAAIKEEIKEMSFRTSYAIQILDREDGNKLKIFYMPKTCFDQVLTQYTSVSNEKGELLFSDPEMQLVVEGLKKDPESNKWNDAAMAYCDTFDAHQGYDIDVSKVVDKGQTKYTAAVRRNPCPALPTPDAIDDLLANCLDLEKIVEDALAAEDVGELEAGAQAAIDSIGTKGTQLNTQTQDPDQMSFARGARGAGGSAGGGQQHRRQAPAADDQMDYEAEAETGTGAEGVLDDEDAQYMETAAAPASLPPRPAPSRAPAPARTAPAAARTAPRPGGGETKPPGRRAFDI